MYINVASARFLPRARFLFIKQLYKRLRVLQSPVQIGNGAGCAVGANFKLVALAIKSFNLSVKLANTLFGAKVVQVFYVPGVKVAATAALPFTFAHCSFPLLPVKSALWRKGALQCL